MVRGGAGGELELAPVDVLLVKPLIVAAGGTGRLGMTGAVAGILLLTRVAVRVDRRGWPVESDSVQFDGCARS